MNFQCDFGGFPMESCCGCGPARFLVFLHLFCNDFFWNCCCGQWFFVDISLPCSARIVFSMKRSCDFRRFPMESCCACGPTRFLSFRLFCKDLFSKCCCGQWHFGDISLTCSVALVFAIFFSSLWTSIFNNCFFR